jgi:TRAP-type C4-dicarboxylate transport system permease small subunit
VVSDKFYEVTKFYSLTKHTYPPIAWFTNLRKYKRWPGHAGGGRRGRARRLRDGPQGRDRQEKDGLARSQKSGVKVNEVKDLKAFQSRMKPAYDSGRRQGRQGLAGQVHGCRQGRRVADDPQGLGQRGGVALPRADGVLACDLMLGVFSRYVPVRTFTWYDEIARACFVWVVFLGAASASSAARISACTADRHAARSRARLAALRDAGVIIAFSACSWCRARRSWSSGASSNCPSWASRRSGSTPRCRSAAPDDPYSLQALWRSVRSALMIAVTCAVFAVLLVLAVPVAFTIGTWRVSSACGGAAAIRSPSSCSRPSSRSIRSCCWRFPLFILAGALMETGGIAVRLVRFAQALVGWIRGGLAMAVSSPNTSSPAYRARPSPDVSAIGATMIPPMTRAGLHAGAIGRRRRGASAWESWCRPAS